MLQWWLRYKDSKWRDLPEELRRRIQSDSLPNLFDREALLNHTVGRRIVKPFLAETLMEEVPVVSFKPAVPMPPIKLVIPPVKGPSMPPRRFTGAVE